MRRLYVPSASCSGVPGGDGEGEPRGGVISGSFESSLSGVVGREFEVADMMLCSIERKVLLCMFNQKQDVVRMLKEMKVG